MTEALTLCLVLGAALARAALPDTDPATPELIQVPPGDFVMGKTPDCFDRDLCFHELPAHRVTLSRPFAISVAQVTADQFRQFQPDFIPAPQDAPYATGVTWHDAVAYCEWLSRTEGRPYRLPTEAEWEYAARRADALGLRDMLQGSREWCLDWFGEYPDEPLTDPVGPDSGLARVVRGGCLDEPTGSIAALVRYSAPRYRHASHRAGIGAGFGLYPGAPDEHGRHRIGFRVVQAPLPPTAPWPATHGLAQLGVKSNAGLVTRGPDPASPYLRKRILLPIPPDDAPDAAIEAAGLPLAFRGHNHSPALTVCPNGDVLLVIYTSHNEYEPEVSLIAARLRLGADEWDMPSPLVDFPGANDHAPLLFTEGNLMRLFWGSPQLPGGFPFQWIESLDSGATWSEPRFPHFTGVPGPHSRQPISSAFRGAEGTLYVSSDAAGPSSVLWATDDDGATWRDTGGRSAGRHTAYCLLSDGAILGMGGKVSQIDGYMPGAISRDGGRSWEVFRSVFPAQGNNQRPSLLRLRSGRLFFAGDFQDINGNQPQGIGQRGSYVALSDDDGKSWRIKRLPGTQPHQNPALLGGADTLGYSAAAQAPNGMIHLITTMNTPCLHFELNEAWIMDPDAPDPDEDALLRPAATRLAAVSEHTETYPDGSPHITWSGGLADDGRYLLDGTETWRFPDGRKQYEVTYRLGRRAGTETLWRADGSIAWQWQHEDPDAGTWTQFWPGGNKRAESHWRGRFAHGLALTWAPDGTELSRAVFTDGQAQVQTSDPGLLTRILRRPEPGAAVPDSPCYLDRQYRITALPPELHGADLLRTANDDDYSTRPDQTLIELTAAATIYVCYWAEAHDLPAWLKSEEWRRLPGEVTVRIADQDKAYHIYARTAPAGQITLGGNERTLTGAAGMYFVIARPR